AQDASLLALLKDMALRCWKLFDLRGYARVDFRVDREGRPWILEVNANPCLSPDAGFSAAALRAGLTFPDVLGRIINKGVKFHA
ncbi:MAG: D-alanine--D-alanine ligase, partial [Deltaproteobacteria bacterium]|nr:D-alanine--D-alanine ligase [Deltaproteobacteria bacterium]